MSCLAACGRRAAAFERDEFDGRFGFRLATSATDGDIERIVRRTGEVALVSVGDPVDVAETAERGAARSGWIWRGWTR